MTHDEVADGEVALVVTSPPYYNAPFDYPDLFSSYEEYLELIGAFASHSKRVLGKGRICAIVTDDMMEREGDVRRGKKDAVVADTTRVLVEAGLLDSVKINGVNHCG